VGASGEPPRGIRTMGEAPRKLTLEQILLYSLASAGLNIMTITVRRAFPHSETIFQPSCGHVTPPVAS